MLDGDSTESGRTDLLQGQDRRLAIRIGRWRESHPHGKLLLVIDQLEELVTMCRDNSERELFLQLLAVALEAHPDILRMVLTVRSDFEPQFTGSALSSLWRAARFVVTPMSQDELREAIEKPASERVLYFEPPAVVDELINEVVQTPGGLPLLSFTLSEMYVRYLERRAEERRADEPREDNRALTRADYQALGGVVGALRQRATEEYTALDEAHQATMRRVMLRMVSLEGGEVARRRVPRSELEYLDQQENQRVAQVINRLTAARLLVEGREFEGEPYVEPAHDELVRGWDKLWDWIRAERQRPDDLLFQRRLTEAAREWSTIVEERTRTPRLWQDPSRSALLHEVLRSTQPWLNRVETAFADQSIKRWRRNRRRLFGTVLLILLFGAGAAVAAFLANRSAIAEKLANKTAVAARDTAVSRELSARVDRYLREGRYDLALLAAAQAANVARTYEARNALLTALQQSPVGVLQWADTMLDDPVALAVSPGGDLVAAVQQTGERKCRTEHTPGLKIGNFELPPKDSEVCVQPTTIVLWEAGSRRWSSRRLEGVPAATQSVALSPDSKLLAAGGDSVALYEISAPQIARRTLDADSGAPAEVVFGPDGRTLTAVRRDGRVVRWDVAERRPAGPAVGNGGRQIWSLSGDTLATLTRDNDKRTVTRWDLASGRRLDTRAINRKGTPLALAPGGADSRWRTRTARFVLWDLPNSLEAGQPLPPPPEPLRLSAEDANMKWERGLRAEFRADGMVLALAINDRSLPGGGSILLWEVSKKAGRSIPRGVRRCHGLEQGRSEPGGFGPAPAVDGVDVGARRQVTRVLAPGFRGGTSVAFSPDSRTLASGATRGW